MKQTTMLLLGILFCCVTQLAAAQPTNTATGMKPTVVTPDSLKFAQDPQSPKGVLVAIVEGNPNSGPYTVRLKIPAGTFYPAHFHGDTERVTILEGTVWFGVGDVADKSKAMPYGPGTYVSVPKGLHHFAIAQTDVLLQISGVGPTTTTMVKQ